MSAAAPHPDASTRRAERVSVVIPARDAARHLDASVASALAQPEVDEVIVAVGPSADDTQARAAALAHDQRVQVVPNPAGTTPGALNAGIAAASGTVIVRLDAHAQLPAGYVARALATLERTGAANVGGRQVPVATAGFARGVAAAMRSPAGSGGAAYRSGGQPGPADTVYLGVFRRSVLDAAGGFAPDMLRNQDAELNARLRTLGHVVWFDPELEVAYRPRASVSALARQYLQYGRWRRVTMRRHPGQVQPRQFAAPAVVVGLVGSVCVGIVTSDARVPASVIGSYLAGVTAAGLAAADDVRDAPATIVALVTMHLAWGVGFLLGPPAGTRRGPGTHDADRRWQRVGS